MGRIIHLSRINFSVFEKEAKLKKNVNSIIVLVPKRDRLLKSVERVQPRFQNREKLIRERCVE